MKFFIVNADYAAFQQGLYANHPGLDMQPFEAQMRVRWDSLFGVADFYSTNLRALGCEAQEVIGNLRPAQMQWAKEHGLDTGHPNGPLRVRLRRGILPWPYRDADRTLYHILAAQVKAFQPDVFYCMNVPVFGSDFLKLIQGHYRLAVGQHAAPLPTTDIRRYDLMLTSLPNFVTHFRQQGMKSELLRLAFEPRVLDALAAGGGGGAKTVEMAFVGGIGGPHQKGTALLEQLCRLHALKIWGYGVGLAPPDSAIRAAYQGNAWGLEMYRHLQNAKIAFNRHIDIAEDNANNLRLYEATGVGTLLLTDAKQNLAEMFQPGTEVAAYRTAEEGAELAAHYLAHDHEREAMAAAGQKRTLNEHTYRLRMEELLTILARYL